MSHHPIPSDFSPRMAQNVFLRLASSPRRLISSVSLGAFVAAILIYLQSGWSRPPSNAHMSLATTSSQDITFAPIAQYFINYPLNGPNFKDQFGELGQRIQILTEWISASDSGSSTAIFPSKVEEVLLSNFPFLQNPSTPNDKYPFATLRQSFVKGSRGIVIPVGTNNLRFACHLISSLRIVLQSKLPIQIVYAGDEDLPKASRAILESLSIDISFLDLLTIFNDNTLHLATGGWAIKPFALLGSSFEQVILLDADAVFLHPPELLFEQTGYHDSGALFFHDRLLWQHAFEDRHIWWKEQMAHKSPSKALLKSLVWVEDYAEEADSGVVVMDKSRLPILMGLLHTCWQNGFPIRDEFTYRITYGDKETWWFGLELSGANYTFETHYGSMIGWAQADEKEKGAEKVCSFTIAHLDEQGSLIWYNGGLLKNKAVNTTNFEVPTHWMMDGTWEKGGSKPEMSCMTKGSVKTLDSDQKRILDESINIAKEVDLIPGIRST